MYSGHRSFLWLHAQADDHGVYHRDTKAIGSVKKVDPVLCFHIKHSAFEGDRQVLVHMNEIMNHWLP